MRQTGDPIIGVAPLPGIGKALKGLKASPTRGRTLSARTIKDLNITKSQGKRGIEGMKKANGLRNDFHRKIYQNGHVSDNLGN